MAAAFEQHTGLKSGKDIFSARQACWHRSLSAKRHQLALQRRLPAGLSSAAEATWGIAGTWRKGWKLRSETRREPGRASEICVPQTLKRKQLTQKRAHFWSCKMQMCLFQRGFERKAAFKGWWACFEWGVTFENNRWSPQKQTLSIIPRSCNCPALLFCFHFVLTCIHPLRLSALSMPVQHGRGPPGEQTHTAGYVTAQQSPSPFPSFCLLRSHRGPASMPRQSTLWPGCW